MIKVIFTGGTIGSTKSGNSIGLSEHPEIIELFKENGGDADNFSYKYPYSLLSENISDKNYKVLAETLFKNKSADGIIITHGTDTISYTAAIVGYLCSNFNCPVVLVSANKPPREKDSNALENFNNAVKAVYDKQNGVYVCADGKLFSAFSITEASPYTDAFSEAYGFAPKKLPHFDKPPRFDKKILLLRSYPLADFSTVDVSPFSAVLLGTYHSATVNETQAEILLEKCREQGKKLYIAPYKTLSGASYTSTEKIIKKGAVPLPLTLEAAYALLLLS